MAANVTFARDDRALDTLLAETDRRHGLYIFEVNGRVLRVGQSVDIGARLRHHRETSYRRRVT